MNVSLTPKLEEFIRRRIASGLYNNASEVVREALRLLVERSRGGTTVADAPLKADVKRRLAELEKPLRQRGISGLSLFGSVIHGDARPDSDIDVLIDIAPQSHFSLVDLVSVKYLLEEELGHRVDVITREGLDPSLKKTVFCEAEAVF